MTLGDPQYWNDFFEQNLIPAVLAHVILTWDGMTKPGPADREAAISVRLYCALLNGKDRSKHAFLIRYEDVEVDLDLAKATGRKDIVVYPSTLEEVYFCLEAKRLNALVGGARKSLADEYVKEGMQRFVNGKYARAVRHAAMLGYVLDGDVGSAMANVLGNIRSNHLALAMEPPGDWQKSSFRPGDPRVKETWHRRGAESVRLQHLFLA
jgi:hypothetical protein